MCTLEIVRLSLAHLGFGLLPFTYVTLLLALWVYWTKGIGGRVQPWRYLNVGAWAALAVVNAVKLAEEVKEGVDTRKETKYPMVDQVTDVAVMVVVYAVLIGLEFC